jgi:hypothetical protein
VTLHIYTAPFQPATRWVEWIDIDGKSAKKFIHRLPDNKLLWCGHCRRRRPAKNCVAQVYYDCINVWCATGKGCKSKKEIAAKQHQLFKRRSAGQKKRWQKHDAR